MEPREILQELTELATYVAQDDLGHVRERDAWLRVDELLDAGLAAGMWVLPKEIEIAPVQ